MNNYITPQLEIVNIGDLDVICTSGGFDLPEIPLGTNTNLTSEDI